MRNIKILINEKVWGIIMGINSVWFYEIWLLNEYLIFLILHFDYALKFLQSKINIIYI